MTLVPGSPLKRPMFMDVPGSAMLSKKKKRVNNKDSESSEESFTCSSQDHSPKCTSRRLSAL